MYSQQLLSYTKQKRYSYGDLLNIGAKLKKPNAKSQKHFYPKQQENIEEPYSVKLVKNELRKSINMEDMFTKKKNIINNLLDTYKFHPIEEYDSKIYF